MYKKSFIFSRFTHTHPLYCVLYALYTVCVHRVGLYCVYSSCCFWCLGLIDWLIDFWLTWKVACNKVIGLCDFVHFFLSYRLSFCPLSGWLVLCNCSPEGVFFVRVSFFSSLITFGFMAVAVHSFFPLVQWRLHYTQSTYQYDGRDFVFFIFSLLSPPPFIFSEEIFSNYAPLTTVVHSFHAWHHTASQRNKSY